MELASAASKAPAASSSIGAKIASASSSAQDSAALIASAAFARASIERARTSPGGLRPVCSNGSLANDPMDIDLHSTDNDPRRSAGNLEDEGWWLDRPHTQTSRSEQQEEEGKPAERGHIIYTVSLHSPLVSFQHRAIDLPWIVTEIESSKATGKPQLSEGDDG